MIFIIFSIISVQCFPVLTSLFNGKLYDAKNEDNNIFRSNPINTNEDLVQFNLSLKRKKFAVLSTEKNIFQPRSAGHNKRVESAP